MSNKFEEDVLSKLSEPQALARQLKQLEQDNRDLLSQSSPAVMRLVHEYARLAALTRRSEQDNDRLEEILEVANHSAILSFWIVEVDHFIGHYLGLLDEDDREDYRDQQALLRDYAGMKEFPLLPKHRQIKHYICTNQSDLYRPDNSVQCSP